MQRILPIENEVVNLFDLEFVQSEDYDLKAAYNHVEKGRRALPDIFSIR